MLGSGFNKQKLKVNLKLAINRLKLLEKKKSKFVFYFMPFRHCLLRLIERNTFIKSLNSSSFISAVLQARSKIAPWSEQESLIQTSRDLNA